MTNDPKTRALAVALLLPAQFLLAGCPPDKLVYRPPSNEHDDEYDQAGARLIDVLWVVDNSCSMADKQDQVANSFYNFISYFARGEIDYRIGVTTMDIYHDQGQLLGSPQIITPPPQTPDPVSAFQRNVRVGTSGSGDDRGLTAMQMALDSQEQIAQGVLAQQSACLAACASGDSACQTDCKNRYSPSFMRPDAYLYVIAVTDGNDDSFGEVWYFDRYLSQVKGIGNNTTVAFSAIIGEPPQPTCAADVGDRYIQLQQLTGGVTGSICASDFSPTLTNLAYNAAGLRRRFPLTAKPDLATLDVKVHYHCNANPLDIGQPCQNEVNTCADAGGDQAFGITCEVPQSAIDGYTYEAATNTIFFNGQSIPGIRSQVEIHYFSVDAATGS